MTKNEIILGVISLCFFISTCVWIVICEKKDESILALKQEKVELLQQLSNEKQNVTAAKKDLLEAHEILGEVFMASMEDIEAYKRLQKKCKGKK